jgi:hypothetical protein
VRGVAPASLLEFIVNLGPYSFDVYSEAGALIETTRSSRRIPELFDVQMRPEGHFDVHAYIVPDRS